MSQPQPPLQHHCKDCGLFFDSGKSLDVHLQYHKENLLSKWGNSSGEESNNNNVKPSKPPRVAAVPADSSDSVMDRFSPNFNFPVNRATPPSSYHYPADMRPPSVGQEGSSRPNSNYNPNAEPDYILGGGSGFPQRRTPTPTSPSPHLLQTSSSFRFHPYQPSSYSHPDQRNGGSVSSSSPGLMLNQPPSHQCEKCGFVCESSTMLFDHVQNAHPPTPPDSFDFNNDYLRPQEIKNEPQAEILDLDSHKVHVYQPPPGEEGSQNSQSSQIDPAMVPWITSMQEKKLFHHPMQMNGSGMPSPDFHVSTTTLNSPEMPHQSYHYDHHINSPNQLPPQITSTQMASISPKPSMQSMQKGSGNASWKSNEARRPKTYNCTACNKWFTSSGHLKRHYNTTLHKNAVKQSGIPDPANLPVSNHHHPPKDPAPPFIHQDSPPASQIEESQLLTKLEDSSYERSQQQVGNNGNHFLSNPPNSLAGPSEVTGGLLLHSSQYQTHEDMRSAPHTLPHMQHHQNFLPFSGTPHHTYPQGMTMYPNLQPPHVSSIQQTVTNNTTGNLDVLEQTVDLQNIWGPDGDLKNQLIALSKPTDNDPLPSFNHFAQNFGGFVPQFSAFGELSRPARSTSASNVGGLSPSRVSNLDSFYASPSPNSGYQITNVHTIDEETFSPSGDSNTLPPSEHGSYDSSISSPENALPTSTDDMERPIPLEHIKIEENSVTSTISEPQPLSSQIKCIDCDKVFNKACYLTQHNKSFHTGERPYKCEKCGKRFEIESQRLEHLSKHAGEKPYKCEICPKQFNHKTDLRRHMCLHSGDKPFCCHVCGKGFIRKDHMVKHVDTHKKKNSAAQLKVLYNKEMMLEPEVSIYPVPMQVSH